MKNFRTLLAITLSVTLLAGSAAAQDKLYSNTFSLSDVQLLDGPFKHACDLNAQVLLQYDMDRLLAPALKEAGLQPKAEYFPNWEGLDGHMVGHYLSALAMAYAATGNQECLDRLNYCLNELERAQIANGDGYIGGVPNGKYIFSEVQKGNFRPLHGAWVPWYNVHKTFAGLRDAWQYAGVEKGKTMFLRMCDWALSITGGLTDAQVDDMVSQEFGGMDEVLADAYYLTGDRKYIVEAKRFAHRRILDSMAAGIDNLDNLHANTQVPKVVGYARIADLDSDEYFKTAAEFFWDRVANYRSVVIGGNSRSEHFPSDADYISFMEHREGPESCNTNNMLKLTEFLYKMDPDAKYADFYERALYNHILSTQHPDHGGYVYFTSMRPSHYRVYSAPNMAMWCCAGTGMENHCKYGQFIYTHEGDDQLSVNLFIASRLNWKKKGVVITQETSFPYSEQTRLTVNTRGSKKFNLRVRCPEWAQDGFSVKVNGKPVVTSAEPGSYVSVQRKWKNGDVVEVSLPMGFKVEELQNEPEFLAVRRGPIVLAARTSSEHLDGLIADDGRWAHIASGELVPLAETPILIGTKAEIERKVAGLQPVPGKPFHYAAGGLYNSPEWRGLELEPFFSLHDSRYAIYFLSLTDDGYAEMREKIRLDEQAALELDRRTVDKVTPGEQQPEVDHRMAQENSQSGYQDNSPYRSTRRGGSFSYELATGGQTALKLAVGYWGREASNPNMPRTLVITVDDQELVTEKDFPSGGDAKVVVKEYDIPESMVSGKEYVRIGFKAAEGSMAARVFDVRTLR